MKILISTLALGTLLLAACTQNNDEPAPTLPVTPPTSTTPPASTTPPPATTLVDGFQTRTVVNNLDIPWELVWGSDNFIWATERRGTIVRVNPETGAKTEILRLTDCYASGDLGLLGMALHPDFRTTPHVFIVYTYQNPNVIQKVVRYTYNGTNLVEPQIILDRIDAGNTHVGSRLLITPDRRLLVTTGDAQNTSASQSMTALSGKVLRMNLDGTIPTDNPFPNSYIYTLGHRNSQGLLLHPNGLLYSSEHGTQIDDELNIIERGRNYGWPNVIGKIDNAERDFATRNNVVESIFEWTPNIAPADLAWYASDRIPSLRNKMLMAVLRDQYLSVLTLSANGRSVVREERLFPSRYGRLRDVLVSPDGRIFLATNGSSFSNTNPGTHSIIEISGER
jgi:aldose sugar dehydrogenase